MRLRSAHSRGGFSLIEILAVVVIIGLATSLLLPNMSATRGSRLRQQAIDVAGRIELTREQAIVSGAPHRLMIDLETGGYRIEWFVGEQRAAGIRPESEEAAEPLAPATAVDLGGKASISLSPPPGDGRDYYPIRNRFGREDWLPEGQFFEGVQTPEGWIDRGSVQIVFDPDGTTDAAEVVLSDIWQNSVTLEIRPLLDTVRIRDDAQL